MLFWVNLPLLSAKKEYLTFASQSDNHSTMKELRGHAPKETETELNFRNEWIDAIKQRQVCESWKDILTRLCISYENLRHSLVWNTQGCTVIILITQSCHIYFVFAGILKWSLGWASYAYLSMIILDNFTAGQFSLQQTANWTGQNSS